MYPIDTLGQVLLGDYLVPFEIVSVLLLVVMIGAAYLAKGRRAKTKMHRHRRRCATREGVVVNTHSSACNTI